MKARLTERMIERQTPQPHPYEIHDTKQPGLVLRVQSSGVKSFKLRYGRNGVLTFKPRYPSLGLDAARELSKVKIGEIAERGAPSGLRPKGTGTFESFLDDYYAPAIADRKAHAATIAAIRSVFKEWLSKPLRSISYLDVERLKAARLKARIAPATINRDLDRARAALNMALKIKLIDSNPVPDVKRFKIANDRDRHLSVDEEKALRKALADREKKRRRERKSANARLALRKLEPRPVWPDDGFTDHLTPLVLLAMNTGLRRGELLGLTWARVDLERKQLNVSAIIAKTEKPRHIPLNAEALDVLQRWKKQGKGEGHVFPGLDGERMGHINRSWNGIAEAAGLTDFRFHDLRHSFASRLAMSGVDLYSVQKLLGHSDSKLTQRYAHLSPDHLADAVAKLAAKR
jgi:integrase